MKYLSMMQGFQLISILILSSNCLLVKGWTNEEFEMFDLVEELNSANFYEFLGVSNDATVKEIKSAYRKLSVQYHPDKNPDDPNAATKFRQLVGVYEALKDEDLRKAYHQVLEFGLPNWRQPMFYFRRARKLAMWQVGILLLAIITTGQYLAAWGSYFEKKLSLQEMVETKLRKSQRSKKAQKDGPTVDEVTAQLEQEYLIKPSLWNTAPIQLLRFGKYMIISFPFDLAAYIKEVKQERLEKQEQLLEQQRLEEEEEKFVPEPKKPRKRKTFQIPEKEQGGEGLNPVETEVKNDQPIQSQQNFVSGGLWTDDDITLLIKLCSKYPGGFPDRWNTISNIMQRPVGEVTHFAKRVMEDLSKRQVEEDEEDKVAVKVKVKTKASKLDDELAEKVMSWGKEEQKRLEMALQMYPKGGSGDRWGKIASHVGKSKEECMQRFKYVADLVKKKKEKVEPDAEVDGESKTLNQLETLESSEPSKKETTTTEVSSPGANVKKESVGRQNSSSSNYSGSDNEWCIVDENTVT